MRRLAGGIAVTVLALGAGCGRSGFDLHDWSGAVDDASSSDGDDGALGDAADDSMLTGILLADLITLGNLTPPSARRASGAAVAGDDRVWIFGGFVGGVGAQSDLYVYTPGTGSWMSQTGTGTPTARERHALGWDAAGSALVVFGGYTASLTHLNELYIYVPGTNTWSLIPVAGAWPAARKDAVMAWVPSLNQMLLYGGNDGSGPVNRFDDLWLLSINVPGVTATWTLLAPGGATPPKQSAPCVGYDPAARRLVLFGGQTQDNTSVATTYQYFVDTNVWQLDTPTGTVPTGRSFSNCAWDPVAGRLVLYGGQNSGGAALPGVYAYDPDGKRWDALAPATGSATPGSCSDAGAAYSASLGGMFLFGGRTATVTYTNETQLIDLVVE